MKEQKQDECSEIRAIIADEDGRKQGKYFVVYPVSDLSAEITTSTPITCSYNDWQGESKFKKGMVVILGPLHLFVKGWRTKHARPIEFKAERSSRKEKTCN